MEEPNKERIAELSKKLGLNDHEQPTRSLFNGDFGTSINLSIFIPAFIIFVVTAFLLLFFWKRKKRVSEN